jgi:transposase
MLTLPPSVRVFLCAQTIDLRLGHDGLAARVRATWGDKLFEGHLFVFLGKRLDRCKILFWDQGGFVLYYKRLERGCFRRPATGQAQAVEIDGMTLTMLLAGIDVSRVRRPATWQPSPKVDKRAALCFNRGVVPPVDEHECGWRDYALEMESKMQTVTAKLEALERRLFGKKTEKMPPPVPAPKGPRSPEQKEQSQAKRKTNAAAKQQLPTDIIQVPVPEEQRHCPHCERSELRPVGVGTPAEIYDFVAPHFRRRQYLRETLACRCGQYIVTAPAPERTTERTSYAPGFIAHLMVSKCSDALPIYRQAKQYARSGVPIARSTMNDLLHRHAELLKPLYHRLLATIVASRVVQADETPVQLLEANRKGYIWTFLAGKRIAYVFSAGRSGDTAKTVLADSQGALVVDGFTGYNKVTIPGGRQRVGCLAHARRKLFEARDAGPEVDNALAIIGAIYRIEADLAMLGHLGTSKHLRARQQQSRPLMALLLRWCRFQRGHHPPRSKLGQAIGYVLRQRKALSRFLSDASLPLDNNASERALRRWALGRKNWLFVGTKESGANLAAVGSLVASCEAEGINPLEYLADVLRRVSDHPASRIDELLPERWRPP